jgi:REP element-mobilizing transposase RayT
MMGRPKRNEVFTAGELGLVHVVQRCVRRAWLAGVDAVSGKDFSFRREWIRRRMEALASVMAIDVLTYAILSNHVHLVLRNRPDVVAAWSDEEVALRWLRVFPGRQLDEQLAEPTENDVRTLAGKAERIAEIRLRLSDISWFMRALSEPIARMANKQDEVTGRFWEGRFKAQKIVDDAGLLACAMYVDLNPVRAAMAESPDQSQYTAAYDRIQAGKGEKIDAAAFDLVPVSTEEAGKSLRESPVEELKQARKSKRRNPTGRQVLRDSWLSPLELGQESLSSDAELHRDGLRASDKGFLNLSWSDYIALLRWTAQQRVKEAVAAVPAHLLVILSKLGIEGSMWRDLVWNYKRYFGKSSCAGSPESMAADAQRLGKSFHRGQRQIRECFAVAST